MHCMTAQYCFVCHLIVLFYNYEFYNDKFNLIKYINETSYVTETFEYYYTFINRIKKKIYSNDCHFWLQNEKASDSKNIFLFYCK